MEMGTSSAEKVTTSCSTLSSKMRKLSASSPVTRRLKGSVTVALISARSTSIFRPLRGLTVMAGVSLRTSSVALGVSFRALGASFAESLAAESLAGAFAAAAVAPLAEELTELGDASRQGTGGALSPSDWGFAAWAAAFSWVGARTQTNDAQANSRTAIEKIGTKWMANGSEDFPGRTTKSRFTAPPTFPATGTAARIGL